MKFIKNALYISGLILLLPGVVLADDKKNEKEESKQMKSEQKTSSSKKQSKKSEDSAPIMVVTHYAIATANKCWATFYNDEGFQGESVTLVGNNDLKEVDFDLKPGAIGGSPDSVIVGPGAKLELYGDEDFEDLDHSFTANSSVSDLNKNPFWDDIESVKLKCDTTSPADQAFSE